MHNVAQLRRLKEQFPDELVIIGVHSAKFAAERESANIRQAILKHDVHHPVVNDAGFKVWNAYNVHAWPTVVLIDPRGEVVGSQAGEIQAEAFVPVLEKMIAEYEMQGLINRQPLDLQAEAIYTPRRPLNYPSKVLFAPGGRFFIADTGNHRVLELRLDADRNGAEVVRVFGSGQPGMQDGPIETAAFHSPRGMALIGDVLYVADTDNHAVRAVDLHGASVRTVAGTGEKGSGSYSQSTPTQIALRSPWALLGLDDATEDGHPVLFIAMAGSHQIWLLLNEERLGIFAGDGREALTDGVLGEASFNQPSDLALGMGHLLVADAEASAIRAISLNDEPRVLTLVGQGLFEFGDIDAVGASARLQHPLGLAFGTDLIYIADTYNHKIKTLDPTTGTVKTLIGTGAQGQADGAFETGELFGPEGLAFHAGRLYIADTNNHLIRVADLEKNSLHTLTLRGLERLPATLGYEAASRRLDPVTVAPGPVAFTFEIQLPPGYKLNPDAPLTVRQEQGKASATHSFDPQEPVTLGLEVTRDRDVTLDVSVYYCQEEDERLCMIHDQRLVVPVTVQENAPSEVYLPYTVEVVSSQM